MLNTVLLLNTSSLPNGNEVAPPNADSQPLAATNPGSQTFRLQNTSTQPPGYRQSGHPERSGMIPIVYIYLTTIGLAR